MPDEPLNYRFGGGAAASLLHPVVLVAMLVSCVLIVLLPRRWVVIPLLCFTLLTPSVQQIYIAGFHFFTLRIVVLVGLLRCVLRMERRNGLLAGGMLNLDRAFLLCLLAQSICVVLLFHAVSALIYETGFLWDFGGGYILLRMLIRNKRDIRTTAICLVLLAVPLGLEMLYEQTHVNNLFGLFGGLPLKPEVRDGAVRAQGDFLHPLLAGTFGGVIFSLALLLFPRHRLIALLGSAGAILMVYTSHSSTPLLAQIGSMIALLVWPLRAYMKNIRRMIIFGLVLLQLIMKAPVYYLIARIDLTGSSSSYHRALLVDAFVRNINTWWLIGTANNGNWGLDTFDVQNQFVQVGVRGGMTALLAMVLTFIYGFSRAGRARLFAEGSNEAWEAWMIGGMLFANIVAFFGVNYFDQTRYLLLIPLAMVAAFRPQPRMKTSQQLVKGSAATMNNPLPQG